jgi:hypothetical protein
MSGWSSVHPRSGLAPCQALPARSVRLVGELPGGEPVRIGHHLFGSNPVGTGCTDLAIEADERGVLATQTGLYGGPYAWTGRVVRVDLATGAVSVLVPGGLDAPGTFTCGTVGIALGPAGATALIAEYRSLRALTHATMCQSRADAARPRRAPPQ